MHRISPVLYMVVFVVLVALALWEGSSVPEPVHAGTVPPTPTPTLIPSLPPSAPPLSDGSFVPISPPGFGDRQNSWAWAMTWWNGYLYVGTNRAWHCMEVASTERISPLLGTYPPDDPDVECTSKPEDLPLQAEIWRWSPDNNVWQRVYQSPRDVPITGGKLVSRDIGFRGLSVYTDPDGTEALYVGSVSPRFVWEGTPPPRILRSTDGLNFEPVPQTPGTVLGDLPYASLRNQIEFQGRFFILAGSVQGSGVLLEAANPAGGDDNFQIVSPPNVSISAVTAYNGYLYLGVRNIKQGYGVIRTKATGSLPYVYETIVEAGAYLPDLPNIEVLGMEVFQDRLYVGTNGILLAPILMGPAELIRINPDGRWELVMGDGRETPDGWKYPLSGFTAGFGNFYNAHVWRMAVFEDQLYVGTFDSSTIYRNVEDAARPIARDQLGFDLFRSANGRDFIPVTRNGFDDQFNFGVRSLEVGPPGLFLGTANYYYGLQVWLLPTGSRPNPTDAFIPLLRGSTLGSSVLGWSAREAVPPAAPAPEFVEAIARGGDVVVAWEAARGAQKYQVWRSAPLTTTLEGQVFPAGWGQTQLAVETSEARWTDTGAAGQNYLYYVTSVAPGGAQSAPSNLALLRTETVYDLMLQLDALQWSATGVPMWEDLQQAFQTSLERGNFTESLVTVDSLRHSLAQPGQTLLPAWQVGDAIYALQQLQRRLTLIVSGLLQP